MNARRYNNNIRGRNRGRNNRGYIRNGNNRNSINSQSNELIMRNIPKQVITDIIRNNPTQSKWNISNKNRYRNRRRKNIKNINKKMNQISKGISIPTTNMNSMLTNRNKTKKEVRRDKLITPMSMVLSGQFLPITKISERCIINYTYTKLKIIAPQNGYDKTSLVLFPYSINFKPDLFNQIDEKVLSIENSVNNVFYNVLQANIGQNHTYNAYATTATGIIGNWKLIGTSYKLYNTTARMYVGGNVTVTKLTDNIIAPLFTNTQRNVGGDLGEFIKSYVEKNYDLVQPKNSFGATDIIRIDEFNTSTGTNIFQGPTEYIGCKYLTDLQAAYPKFSQDTVGNNVKYLVEIYGSTTNQAYVLEIWNVFAIIPAPTSGLSNVVKTYNDCFNPSVVNEMRTRVPIYSSRKI